MYTQHWINHLLSRFSEMKTAEPDRLNEEITAELVQWTLDNRDSIYSAFLTTKGTFNYSRSWINLAQICQASTQRKTHQSNFFTPSC
jgi:hypothetical protein